MSRKLHQKERQPGLKPRAPIQDVGIPSGIWAAGLNTHNVSGSASSQIMLRRYHKFMWVYFSVKIKFEIHAQFFCSMHFPWTLEDSSQWSWFPSQGRGFSAVGGWASQGKEKHKLDLHRILLEWSQMSLFGHNLYFGEKEEIQRDYISNPNMFYPSSMYLVITVFTFQLLKQKVIIL